MGQRRLDGVALLRLLGACMLMARCVSSCAAAAPTAEAAFTAEHLRCVDRARTLAESRACRADVNRRWGVTETVADGGVP
jgi:hypothetical protein